MTDREGSGKQEEGEDETIVGNGGIFILFSQFPSMYTYIYFFPR